MFINKEGQWEKANLQIDPMDEDGILTFNDTDANQNLSGYNRLVFYKKSFGSRFSYSQQLPMCQNRQALELQKNGKYAYLIACSNNLLHPRIDSEQPQSSVLYNMLLPSLQSELYTYKFNPDNHMLFKSIDFSQKRKIQRIADNSNLLIFSDLKNFFSLSFEDDIQSQLNSHRIGPLGVSANVNFFLEILFFKIKLSLMTDVNFFPDSAHIPMKVYTPYDTKKHLNTNSGILYSWLNSEDLELDSKSTILKFSEFMDINNREKKIKALCPDRSECIFKLIYNSKSIGNNLVMEFHISKELLTKNFYPVFIDDLSQLEKLSWPMKRLNRKIEEKQVGLFFAISALGQGESAWDFWLRLGNNSQSTETCPDTLHAIRRL